jgi:hypothetical protein
MRTSITQHSNVMNLLVQQKKWLDILEVECNMLRNLALNLRRDSLSSASNDKDPTIPSHAKQKDEDMVHQLKEPMDIELQHSPYSEAGQEEVNSFQAFC